MENNSVKGVIHIIDDEKDIVAVATKALEQQGYVVHSFSDAHEALKDIQVKCRKRVMLLITDVRMPGVNGFEIARKTRDIIPDVPIIFITAFEVNSIEFDKVFPSLSGRNEFLQKPFHIEKLLQVVRKYAA